MMYILCPVVGLYLVAHILKCLNFLLLVKEHNSDKKSEADSDCAEQDVGCWSQKWSAR